MRLFTLLLLLTIAACDPPTPGATTAKPSASASAAPKPTAAASTKKGPDYADADVIVPADHEDDAEKAVTKENYKEQLAAVVAELDGKAAE